MKRILIALAAATVLASPAFAATKIGVSMDKFDDNFLTVLRNGISDYAKTQPGVTVQIEDAKDDVSKQISQVQNFIANGVDRDHRQSRRHVRDRRHHQRRGRGRRAARLRQPPAGRRREARAEGRFRRLERGRVRHARDQGDLQAARRQGRHSGDSRASSPTRPRFSGRRTSTTSSRPTPARASRSSPSRPRTGIAPRRRT